MKVSLVYPDCHPRGGVERVVWQAAHHLAPRHDVTVVTARPAEVPAGARQRSIGRVVPLSEFAGAAGDLLDPAGLVVSFGTECPPSDVLVMGSVHRAWVGRGGAVEMARLRVPGDVRRVLRRHRLRLRLERRSLASTRGPIVAVSTGVRADLQRFYGVDPGRVRVVPNGFEPEQCSPRRRAALRGEARGRLGLDDSTAALLLVANEWHRKGLGVLLTAMAKLGDPQVVLLLAGRMAPSAYTRQIGRLGLGDRLRYLGPVDDVGAVHAAADVFVLPTQYEPFGSVILEAMASGLPVIASACAGAAELIEHGVNGLRLEDPADAGELAGLIALALDPPAGARLGERAASSVSGYEWPSVMAALEGVLEEAWAIARV